MKCTCLKTIGNFLPTVFRKFRKFWKVWIIPRRIFRKFLGFLTWTQRYRAKIYIFNSTKHGRVKENFGESFEKFPKFWKFTKNFPGNFSGIFRKIPGKHPTFFLFKYDFTELKSLFLLVWKEWKSRKTSRKILGKFPKFQKFPEEISPENFPKIPGVFFD